MKKILFLIVGMGIAAFVVITLDQLFNMPDEITGILYFISIGIAASSVLNYFKE